MTHAATERLTIPSAVFEAKRDSGVNTADMIHAGVEAGASWPSVGIKLVLRQLEFSSLALGIWEYWEYA